LRGSLDPSDLSSLPTSLSTACLSALSRPGPVCEATRTDHVPWRRRTKIKQLFFFSLFSFFLTLCTQIVLSPSPRLRLPHYLRGSRIACCSSHASLMEAKELGPSSFLFVHSYVPVCCFCFFFVVVAFFLLAQVF